MLKRTSCLIAIICCLSVCPCLAKAMWVKGQTHCHSTESDGKASPQEVADWYRTHGFQFVFITDHNKMTDPTKLNVPSDGFILIPGEEVTTKFNGYPIHVNGLGITKTLAAEKGNSRLDTMQKDIDVIVNDGGIADINHPNWHWGLGEREMSRARGCNLFEIHNGPGDYEAGDAEHPSIEAVWDTMLSKGLQMYGLSVDDAHDYKSTDPKTNMPGLGWIVVRVNKLTAAEVLSGISRGDFYGSTGVELQDVSFRDGTMTVTINPTEGKTYKTQFIGFGGKIVKEVDGPKASCRIADEPNAYLRAKVIASDGKLAWVQPVRKSK